MLARTTERGLDAGRLRQLGLDQGRLELVAAADFMDQYDEVLGNQNALDYPSLIADAVAIPGPRPPRRPAGAVRQVFVDEYQDTDPSQVALLRALAGGGRDLIVVGDP